MSLHSKVYYGKIIKIPRQEFIFLTCEDGVAEVDIYPLFLF